MTTSQTSIDGNITKDQDVINLYITNLKYGCDNDIALSSCYIICYITLHYFVIVPYYVPHHTITN